MNVRATAKFVGTSPRKIGLVAALIRGRSAKEAVSILEQTQKRATGPVGKVLQSAIANAENNFNLKSGDLVVESVLIGPAPTLKRFRPRAQGRAGAIRKRSSHISVVLNDVKSGKASSQAASRRQNSASEPVSSKVSQSSQNASDKLTTSSQPKKISASTEKKPVNNKKEAK